MLLFFFLSCLIENFCLHLQRNFICNCNCLIINMFESEFESRFPLNARRIAKSYPFFCAFRGRVRNHIDNPSKPPFDKGGFAWSRKRESPRATPRCHLSGGCGCKNSSREIAHAQRGLESRFPLQESKTKRTK